MIFSIIPAFGGKYVAEFLEVGVGVRAAGMGEAYCAAGEDASAFWWNPAAPAGHITPQLYMMHSALYANMYQLDALAYRDKLWGTYLAVSLLRLATDNIPFTRSDGFYDYGPDGVPGTGDEGEGNGVWDPGEPVDATAIDMKSEGDYSILIGAAIPISKNLAWGISGKILRQNIGGYTNFGIGADLGFRYKLSERLKFGLTVLDITGTHLKWSTGYSESKLPSLRLGSVYTIPVWKNKIDMLASGDLEMRFEGASESALIGIDPISMDTHLGVEFSFWKHFFTRLGLDRTDFTAGAGLKIARFQVDYAFIVSSIDYVHRVSITLDFNPRIPPGVQTEH